MNKFSQFRFSQLEIGRLAYSKVAASGRCHSFPEGIEECAVARGG
jgi:hypothetical protein